MHLDTETKGSKPGKVSIACADNLCCNVQNNYHVVHSEVYHLH